MDINWVMENADIPIKYILTNDKMYYSGLFENYEVHYWLSQLKIRSENDDISNIHGSHDYRMENILGKCFILGLNKTMPTFSHYLKFIIDFLNKQLKKTHDDELTFDKIYSFRDNQKVLTCFLPMLGYSDEPSVRYIAEKRIDILYKFSKKNQHDIYVDASEYSGIKKEWQPYIINPELYADGNIALPDMHDFILFAGMYDKFDKKTQDKIENIIKWILDDKYKNIIGRYGYFYVPGGSYNVKAIIFKMNLIDFEQVIFDKGEIKSLIFICYILSHFKTIRKSKWFFLAMAFLENYKTNNDRYIFPKHMITEKPDNYFIAGGHMNIGENKKTKQYGEIISTYWMNMIQNNIKNVK